MLVQREDHRWTLETLEPEHVAVEDHVLVPEAVPVAALALLLASSLLGVPTPGGQQGDVLGSPSLLEKHVDLVLGLSQRMLRRALDEADVGTLDLSQPHADRSDRREPARDLSGVREVLVEDQGPQPGRRPSESGETPLPLVGKDVQPTRLVVLESGQRG